VTINLDNPRPTAPAKRSASAGARAIGWAARHKVWSAVIALGVVGAIAAPFTAGSGGGTTAAASKPAQQSNVASNSAPAPAYNAQTVAFCNRWAGSVASFNTAMGASKTTAAKEKAYKAFQADVEGWMDDQSLVKANNAVYNPVSTVDGDLRTLNLSWSNPSLVASGSTAVTQDSLKVKADCAVSWFDQSRP
jgi:hypothetical protein